MNNETWGSFKGKVLGFHFETSDEGDKDFGFVNEEKSLTKWFKEKWVDISRPKKDGGYEPCGRNDAGSGKYPKCVPASKAKQMSAEEIRSAVSRKRRAESTQSREDKKPINVSTQKKDMGFFDLEEKRAIPTNPELYARVKAQAKAKFDVYPSAYANAWLVREYKKRGGGYRSEKADSGQYEESLNDLTEVQLSDFFDWFDGKTAEPKLDDPTSVKPPYYHPAEKEFVSAMQSIVSKYGKLEDYDDKGIWVGYESRAKNENYSIGIRCENCAHYESEKVCKIVKTTIEPGGYCRFAAIPSEKVTISKK